MCLLCSGSVTHYPWSIPIPTFFHLPFISSRAYIFILAQEQVLECLFESGVAQCITSRVDGGVDVAQPVADCPYGVRDAGLAEGWDQHHDVVRRPCQNESQQDCKNSLGHLFWETGGKRAERKNKMNKEKREWDRFKKIVNPLSGVFFFILLHENKFACIEMNPKAIYPIVTSSLQSCNYWQELFISQQQLDPDKLRTLIIIVVYTYTYTLDMEVWLTRDPNYYYKNLEIPFPLSIIEQNRKPLLSLHKYNTIWSFAIKCTHK